MRGIPYQRDLSSGGVIVPALRLPIADEAGVRRLGLVNGGRDAGPRLGPPTRGHAPLDLANDVDTVASLQRVDGRLLRPEQADHEVPVSGVGLVVGVVD